MKFFKIITINLLLIFLIYNLIIFVMIGASEIYTIHQDRKITKDENSICIRYSCFKNYENISWAALHYREYSQIKFHYETPVVWRANKFDGKTINISGKYNSRLTLSNLSDEDLIKKKAYFFGGSVMWGFGSNDENTIPSNFEKISKIKSFNFAESAWNSNQSLFYLIKLLKEGHKPDLVVFYNGVNELYKCSSGAERNLRSNVIQEDNLRQKFITIRNASNLTFMYYFSIPLEFFSNLKNKLNRSKEVSKVVKNFTQSTGCSDKKREKITENVKQNWDLANKLVNSYGGKFYAILEPHIIFNKPKLYTFVNLSDNEKENISNIYSEIEKKMIHKEYFKNFKNIFLNYEQNFPIFVDTHHTSPNGNFIIAKELFNGLKVDNYE
jgi:hypothetical protein